jgi:hypothetical protein
MIRATMPGLCALGLLGALGASPTTASPPDLDAFLAARPAIAGAIRFEFATGQFGECHLGPGGLSGGPPPVEPSGPSVDPWFLGYPIRSWAQMPETCKTIVRRSYADYFTWLETAGPLYAQYAASAFQSKPAAFDATFRTDVDLDPRPMAYPPANLQYLASPPPEAARRTIISSSAAFLLFAKRVAFSLALETSGLLDWKLRGYGGPALTQVLDGTLLFRYAPKGIARSGLYTGVALHSGHALMSGGLPGPPLVSFSFLARLGAIRATRLETVHRLLEWERYYLQHVFDGAVAPDCPQTTDEVRWGYNGEAPVPAVINGLVMACPIWSSNGSSTLYPGVVHWIAGCGGASAFNELVLPAVNIGAERDVHSHFHTGFFTEPGTRMWQCHADDPYNLEGWPEIPISATLIDEATFAQYFLDVDPDAPDAVQQARHAHNDRHVSRCTADARIHYLPVRLLSYYCYDGDFAKPHAQQKIYERFFEDIYTVAELEAQDFWRRLNAKLHSLGGCAEMPSPFEPAEIPPMP